MSVNKWSPPVGGTSMGGNSVETLLPVTHTPMRGLGGTEMGASYLHKIKKKYFLHQIHYLQ